MGLFFKSTEERLAEIDAEQKAERIQEANESGQETGSKAGDFDITPTIEQNYYNARSPEEGAAYGAGLQNGRDHPSK
jgi:hypothetical protein